MLNTTGDETLPISNADTLSNIFEVHPILLRDTITRRSKESNDMNKKECELSKYMNSTSSMDLYTYGMKSDFGDRTEGLSNLSPSLIFMSTKVRRRNNLKDVPRISQV